MAIVHRIGEPENASEAKAIKTLASLLSDDYILVHNFELTTGRGLPYEYDLAVIGPFAVWHVEVKGYRGTIQGNQHHWVLDSGYRQPSPIPLANKKSKILAGKLRGHDRRLEDVFVETTILLSDERAQVRVKDPQASRIVRIDQALDYFTDPKRLPVSTRPISHLHDRICATLFDLRPVRRVTQIGLYDVIERINQTEDRTVFLAKHRYIRTRPRTILKVYHFDVYTSDAERQRQIEAIFHDQDALRLLGVHPNLIDTGDMFAWDDNKFVLPTEYVDQGRTLEEILAESADRSISWREKADIIVGTARGLRHAHLRGVIHRDMRPLSVVVGPGGLAKVVNFDLALLQHAPQLSAPKGLERRLDPRYTAPEVWADPACADARADIYSLGILFYELITSERPYASVEELKGEVPLDRELLLKELSTPGSEDFMAAPEDAADVITRMCAYDREARYPSLDGVLEDLSILRED
ncbi:MAG: protein kinase [Planctomycetes bacterium]|nr:protein kinase [Planctomycetota bacterium]